VVHGDAIVRPGAVITDDVVVATGTIDDHRFAGGRIDAASPPGEDIDLDESSEDGDELALLDDELLDITYEPR
jgi:hypothetical protein